MENPLQVTFRNFKHTPELDQLIREQVAELDLMVSNRVISCHVTVEKEHEHTNPVFHARIHLTIPDGDIAVDRQSHDMLLHKDAFVAVRDSFAIARGQLADWERRNPGQKKGQEAR